MSNPLLQSKSLPEYCESDEKIAAQIVIDTFSDGAVKTWGDIEDLQWTREALKAAKKILRDYHAKHQLSKPSTMPKEFRLCVTVYNTGSYSVTGYIADLILGLAAIDNALEGIKSETGRRLRNAVLPAKDAHL